MMEGDGGSEVQALALGAGSMTRCVNNGNALLSVAQARSARRM